MLWFFTSCWELGISYNAVSSSILIYVNHLFGHWKFGLIMTCLFMSLMQFLSSLHPLSGHFRAALQRKGHLNGLVLISVLSVYDAKLRSLCKSINPKVESDPLLIMSLKLKTAPRLSWFSVYF